MKTLLLLILFAPTFCIAQSTTQAEYNYMKLGYREVAEKGNDIKRGYTITELPQFIAGELTINATMLIRNDSTIAGTVLKTSSTAAFGSGVNYYVMPAVNMKEKESYGWNNFFAEVNTMSGGQKSGIIQWLSYRLSLETFVERTLGSRMKK